MAVLTAARLPRGFTFAATACGLKKSALDLGLLVSEIRATAACAFTRNCVKAAPVLLSQANLRRSASRMRAVIVNSGNANCATGKTGMAASQKTAAATARALGCRTKEIIVCSTGVIGVPLRVECILRAIPRLRADQAATTRGFEKFTRAIITTDTHSKWASASCAVGGKTVRLLGCAKGAGMIHPNMATMLAFVVTDAGASAATLRTMLRQVVRRTFNAITVDGDTSTNDTVAVLANGASGAPKIEGAGDSCKFCAALESVCLSLALQIVADGEGAHRVVDVEVRGAVSDQVADRIARTIANSPLVKTALAGGDPNWGRILAAAGRADVRFDPNRAEIGMAGIAMCRNGEPVRFNEHAAHRKLLAKYVPIVLDLHSGKSSARIWTCDFTGDYVRINASYRS